MPIAITLHLLSAVIWVGGMFFAYMALRPVAATLLEPPLRLSLWAQVFQRFFLWVWISILALLATGFWMIFGSLGGMASAGLHVHIMLTIALIMIGLFIYLNVCPYRHLKTCVANEDYKEGAVSLGKIRQIVAINLSLGLINIIIAVAGRFSS